MGENIIDAGEVNVRRIAAGSAHGFRPPVRPAIVIATPRRAGNEDYVVLTLEEAEEVAKALLKHLQERKG